MSIVESTCKANNDEANVAQDIWACVITCNYDSSFIVVNEVNSDWFFNSGASKQILHANCVRVCYFLLRRRLLIHTLSKCSSS